MVETKIEWTHVPGYRGASWNPFAGCTRVSPGCQNCYAERLAGTRLAHLDKYKGLTREGKDGPVWNGKLNLVEADLLKPLKTRKPTAWFVNSMSDLFHESAPDEWLDKIFAVMALCPEHIFMILTKRPERMREYLDNVYRVREMNIDDGMEKIKDICPKDLLCFCGKKIKLPLPNVWLGVSSEDQQRADERIPVLLDTPAAVRFVSAEPLLSRVSFLEFFYKDLTITGDFRTRKGIRQVKYHHKGKLGLLNWIIVGGESGPGKRPMDLAWARSIRGQCEAAGVAFFMKQIDKQQPIPADLLVREWPKRSE